MLARALLKIKNSIFLILLLCIALIIGWMGPRYVQHWYAINTLAFEPAAQQSEEKYAHAPTIIERVVSSNQLWRPVQEAIRDTVVQIIVQAAEIDLLQPYRAPSMTTHYGSGFFINQEGEIITNAHVIEQGVSIWIQVPSLGKRILDAQVIGVSPERDLALLKLTPESLETINQELGGISFLSFGDSDLIRRSDETLAIGYPLGQRSVKTTTGVISGRENHYIQMDTPINPGSSGGPLLNSKGEVIGINTAIVINAQNVGYAIPINDLKRILPDLRKIKLLRKPFIGLLYNNATQSLTKYLGNPLPGGCYVTDVIKGSTLERAGLQSGDMIYNINGFSVDMFGEMNVSWSEDKISIVDFVNRLSVGEPITITYYRKGVKKQNTVVFDMATVPPVKSLYVGLEPVEYEIFAGMVVMPLSLNHIHGFKTHVPGLLRYSEIMNQDHPVLIITHVFPNSQLYRSQTLNVAFTINEINGISVQTLDDFRKAIRESIHTNSLIIKATDNITRATDKIFVVLPWKEVVKEERRLSQDFKYPLTPWSQELLQTIELKEELEKNNGGASHA